MKNNGPALSVLMQRLSALPDDFLSPLRGAEKKPLPNEIDVCAVVSDLIFDTGGDYPGFAQMQKFYPDPQSANMNYLRIVLLICYIYRDPAFDLSSLNAGKIMTFLKSSRLEELAKLIDFLDFITDSERREELSRLALFGASLLPPGENETIFQDRLTTLDSIERHKIIEKTRAAQIRAQELRDELARQAAYEAASKMSRE